LKKAPLLFLLLLLVHGLGPVYAQDAQEASSLNPDLVQARIQVLRDSGAPEGGTPDGGKTTLDSYQEVMNFLREAEAHAAAEQSFTESLSTAPPLEAEIRERMDDVPYRESDVDPASVAKLSSEKIEGILTELRVKLKDATSAKETLDRRITTELSATPGFRARLESIDQRLVELPDLNFSIQPDLNPSDYEAAQWLSLAEQAALVAERRMLEARLASQPVRYSRAKVESDELGLIVDGLQFQVQALETELASRAQDSDEDSIIELDADTPGFATVQQMLAENAHLREQSQELSAALAFMEEEETEVRQIFDSLGKQFETVQQIVALSDNSSSLGHLLMTHWHQIDKFRPADIALGEVGELGDHVIQRAQFEEELAQLSNSTDYALNRFSEDGVPEAGSNQVALDSARELARAKRSLLTDLIALETKLINAHGSIERTTRQLESAFEKYTRYLGSRILWVPSHPPIQQSFWNDIRQDFESMVRSLSNTGTLHLSPGSGLLLIVILMLYLFRRWLEPFMLNQNAKVGRVRQDHIGLTLFELLITFLRSLLFPLLLLILAYGISESTRENAPYLSSSITRSSKLLFLLLFLRITCEKDGLAQVHFGWPDYRRKNIRKLATTLLIWAWPVLLVTAYLFRVEVDSVNVVLGRLIFAIAIMIVIAIIGSHFLQNRLRGEPFSNYTKLVLLLSVLASISLIVTSLTGYIYSGYVLFNGLIDTLALAVGLAVFYSLMKRWLLLVNRRLRFRRKVAAMQAADEETADADAEEVDIVSLSASVTQLLKAATFILGVACFAYLWAPLFSGLEAMQRVTLWTVSDMSQGEAIITSITLASVAMALLVLVITFAAARNFPQLASLILLTRSRVTPGTRYAAGKLIQYFVVGVGIIMVLSILGLRWDRLQWLVAALSLGIGFGLQEIIANFISGLIILFERPIRVGDVITVGESSGKVVKIRIRATTIRDFDGKELLVPNKEFVTGRLLNWTLSDPKIRVVIDVGIAYGSDARRAAAAIEEILLNHPMVLKDPAPFVLFGQFGDSSLNLTARLFTADVDNRVELTSDLHHRIYERLDEEGIVIAFPQLDVHLDPAPAKS
jgi:potassium efflux system protein